MGLRREEPNISPDRSKAGNRGSVSVVNESKGDKSSVSRLQQLGSEVDGWHSAWCDCRELLTLGKSLIYQSIVLFLAFARA